MKEKQRNSRIYILLLVGTIAALGPFVTDFYLSALPGLRVFFKTTTSMTQLSLTFSMIGLAVGQVFIGPISDKYGRRSPLLFSMLFFVASTVACLFAWNIESFVVFRLIQGLAGAGGIVISRSIATDLYEGKELSDFFSMLGVVQGLAPICAPVLGGLLLRVTDWRGIFMALLGLGIVLFFVLLYFRDTLPVEKRQKKNIWEKFGYYKSIVGHRRFMYFILIQSFALGVMFAYIASSPFIFQNIYHLSPLVYSLCFGLNAIGIMIGTIVITAFKSNKKALIWGVVGFMTMCCITTLVLVLQLPVVMVEASFFVFLFFLGMILPTSTTLALNLERENSGNASAVLGFMTFLFGGIVSPLTSIGNILYSTTLIMLVCCISILICTRKVLKPATDDPGAIDL